MIVITKLNLDLLRPEYMPAVYAVQNDRYTRCLAISLLAGQESWQIPNGVSPVIRYTKADGTVGEYDTMPDGDSAWWVRENVLNILLAPQMLTAAGFAQMKVTLIQGQEQLSTFSVLVNVRQEGWGGAQSEDYQKVTAFLPGPEHGEMGQFFQIAGVDAKGRVTRVEAVDLGIETGSGEPMEGDLPKIFLTGSIPTTKDDVLAELDYVSKTKRFHAYLKIKCQGSSSMSYPKKNFTIKLYQDSERKVKLQKHFRNWGKESYKYVLKANYIDHSHARNVVSARLWNEVVESRDDYDTLPAAMRESPRNGAVDGFPVKLYANGTYQGIYTWNIGKDDWMWGMDEENENHVLLCGETNTDGVYGENACNFRRSWTGEDGADWSVEVGSNSEELKKSLNALIGFVMVNDGESFRQGIGEYLDIQSALDYFLFSYVTCGLDSLAKNMLLATYDRKKWICGQYDMDSTFGLWWDGSTFVSARYACPGDYQESYSLLWERIKENYVEELKQRYWQLRSGTLSLHNMVTHFERFTDAIGKELLLEDLTPYPGIPSANTNNIQQLRDFIRDRLKYVDERITYLGEETEDPEDTDVPGTLPEDYTQVEYIQSTGTQYINTGVIGGTDASYEIRFNMMNALAVSYEQYFAGSGEDTVPKLFFMDGEASVIAQCSNDNAEGFWRLGWRDDQTHTVRYEGTEGKLYFDDVECTNYGYVPDGKYIGCGWGGTSWYIFNSPTEPNLMSSMQLHYLKMYSAGKLIRSFVPVVRNADGVAGLFDLVGQAFYENAGSGVFEVGA